MSSTILIVDDEPDISALLAYHLARESYRVRTAATGPEALESVAQQQPDLIILDLMLPGMSGLEVLAELRSQPETEDIPIIMLTAKKEESDRVAGLRQGADDYIAKPFSPQELTLRVAAVLRRVRQMPHMPTGRVLQIGPFRLDIEAARAEVDGEEMTLTPTEFRLLQVLMERRGRVQSRRQLLESVWDTRADITTRTVDMHVQRLRAKASDAGDAGDWIETVRGFGYRFRSEPPS